jgi:UDP-glucose 4-epimerase
MTQHVLITGGAGCIGSDLAAALLDRGCHVTVVDNLSSGKREHVADLLRRPGFRFIEGDLLDPATLDAALASNNASDNASSDDSVEMVYHLAANPDVKFVPGDPTDKDLRQNTICTYNVLESMRRHGVRRLAFSSTSAIYGICERQPIAEDQAPHPISLYGATKLSCEAMIGAFQHLFGMDCWIFRFANVVGPKVRKRGRTVIGDFIDKLRRDPTRLQVLGNGRQAKSYLLAEECVAAMLFAVEHAPRGLNVFNLGCHDSLSVTRIAEMVAAAMGLSGVALEYTGGEGGWLGDVPRFRLDVAAINRLGWRARYNSEEAVALAIDASLAEGRTTSHQPGYPLGPTSHGELCLPGEAACRL